MLTLVKQLLSYSSAYRGIITLDDIGAEMTLLYARQNLHKDLAFGVSVNSVIWLFTSLLLNPELRATNPYLKALYDLSEESLQRGHTKDILSGKYLKPLNRTFKVYVNPFMEKFFRADIMKIASDLGVVQFLPETGAKDMINEDVKAATNGLIPVILKEELKVSANFRQLGNTLIAIMVADYLKAEWYTMFDNECTRLAPFHTQGGNTIQVNMMQSDGYSCEYHQDEEDNKFIRLKSLPSGTERNEEGYPVEENPTPTPYSVLFALPREGQSAFDLFQNLMDSTFLEKVTSNLQSANVEVNLPVITKLDSNVIKMNEVIDRSDSEYKAFFDREESGPSYGPLSELIDWNKVHAELPKNDEDNIKLVVYNTACVIKMNEGGFEAAAVALQTVCYRSIGIARRKPTFRANRPYVFLILHKGEDEQYSTFFAALVTGNDPAVFT